MAAVKQAELLAAFSGRSKVPQCVLVHGADYGAVNDLCKTLVSKTVGNADPLSTIRLTEAQALASPDRLYGEFASRSMFGDKQAIWISEAGDSLVKALEPILVAGEEGNLIVIEASSLSKTSKLRKLCESDKRTMCCALYEESAHEFRARLERQIRAAGLAISEEASTLLAELVSREKSVGDSEVAKLVTYMHGSREISVEDVRAICGDTADSDADELLDAVFSGEMVTADRHVATLQAQATLSKALLPMAMQHVSRLQAMSIQMRQGQSVGDVVAHPRNGIFFKRRSSISHQLQLWSVESLLEAEEKIADAILSTRQMPDLEDSLVSRSFLALAWLARSNSA